MKFNSENGRNVMSTKGLTFIQPALNKNLAKVEEKLDEVKGCMEYGPKWQLM